MTGAQVHVDWLAFTLPRGTPDQAEEILRTAAPCDFIEAATGLLGYEHQRVDAVGARILSTGQRPDVHVQLPGKWCGAVSNEAMRRLLAVLEIAGAVVTRLDLALDDAERLVEPREVWAAIKRGELTGHTRVQQHIEGLLSGEESGETVNLGAGQSRQRVRVYDKAAEVRAREQRVRESAVLASTGLSLAPASEALGVRWEIQAREEPAQTLAGQLRAIAPAAWGEVWAARLVSIADFREAADGRADRRERCAWFERIVGGARKVCAYVAQPARTLAEAKAWLERQVASTFAVVWQAMGGDLAYVLDLAEAGKSRWRQRHRLLLAAARG